MSVQATQSAVEARGADRIDLDSKKSYYDMEVICFGSEEFCSSEYGVPAYTTGKTEAKVDYEPRQIKGNSRFTM